MAINPIFAALRADILNGDAAEIVLHKGRKINAIVHRDQQLIGDYGQVVSRRTEIEVPAGCLKAGDKVRIDAASYLIDTQVSDDGLFTRWVVRLEK